MRKRRARTPFRFQDQAIAAARATLKSAQAQVKLLQTQIVQTSLNAPFDGVITQRLLDPGGFAGPNQPNLADLANRARIRERERARQQPFLRAQGDADNVYVDERAGPHVRRNDLRRQRDADDRHALVSRAHHHVQSDDALRGGMLVSVSVRKEFHPNAIVVPLAAIVQSPTGAAVYTIGLRRRRRRCRCVRTAAGRRGKSRRAASGQPDVRASEARAGHARLQTDTQAQ